MSVLQSVNAVVGAIGSIVTTGANAINQGVTTLGDLSSDIATERRISRKARLTDSLEELEVNLIANKVKREQKIEQISTNFTGDFDKLRKDVRSLFNFEGL